MRMMAEEGRTRGAEILEVVSRGRKISAQDEAVYVVSVVESRKIENVVLATRRRGQFSHCDSDNLKAHVAASCAGRYVLCRGVSNRRTATGGSDVTLRSN